MKKWIYMFCMAVFLASAAPLMAAQPAEQPSKDTVQPETTNTEKSSPAPVANVKEPVFNFDPVPDGFKIVHDFVIQNKGDADLIIKKVHTG